MGFVSYEYAWPYSMLLIFILHYKQHYTTSHVVWDESLKAQSHLYLTLTAVYWTHRAICIKCYDSEQHMNSSSHFVACTIIVTITALSSSDTASLSSLMICCTRVATCNLSLPHELGACTYRPVFWNSCCGRCCWTGCGTLLPSVCGACGCCCWVFWRNTAA
jgi:hypothetical protein